MKANTAIDFSRFVISIAVVIIHCGLDSWNDNLYNIFQCAVPCFFVMSGYFIESKRENNDGYIDNYLVRTIKLYIIWSLIFIPLTIYGIVLSPSHIVKKILFLLYNYLVVGQNYCSWPLWYLLALIYAILIYRIMLKQKWAFKTMIFIVLAITATGYVIEYYDNINVLHIIKSCFGGTTRNGLFQGLSFVFVGIILKRYDIVNQIRKKRACCIVLCMLLIPVCSTFAVPKSLFLDHILCGLTIGLFLGIKPGSFDSRVLREMGIWLYFTHMFTVFAVRDLLQVDDFYTCVIIAVPSSVVISILLYSISKKNIHFKKLITG